MEEESKSNITQNDDVDQHNHHFLDAFDDFFPLYDCTDTTTSSNSPTDSDLSVLPNPNSKPSPETLPPSNIRRRRFLSRRANQLSGDTSREFRIFRNFKDPNPTRYSHGTNPNSSLDSETYPGNDSVTSPIEIDSREGKYKFSHNLKENEGNFGNSDLDSTRDWNDPNSNSSLDSETFPANEPIPNSIEIDSRERKPTFSRKLKENQKESQNLDSFKLRFSSDRSNNVIIEENKENSTITFENNEGIHESIVEDSRLGEIDGNSSSFLFILANLVVKAIGFQLNLLISFLALPIWLLYCFYMFVTDPFRAVTHGKEYLIGKLLRVWGLVSGSVSPFVFQWFKEHNSIWKLGVRVGWGLLLSVYVCVVLVSLMVWALLASGFVVEFLVEEPIQIKDNLNFDYTKTSPVAFVPISDCFGVNCGVDCGGKSEVGKVGGTRVVPPYHKLQVSVSLTLPESEYNRNLGIFQVRIDFLSAEGKVLAISRHPCMLQFKSHPIRLFLTFLKMAPLVTGYLSESQTVRVKINLRGYEPTACLRVIIEQRAEFRPGAGIPEIYSASLTAESELPLLKRILWNWKKTIFIWISMTIFTMELFATLLCCQPVIIPKVRLRGSSSGNTAPVQR